MMDSDHILRDSNEGQACEGLMASLLESSSLRCPLFRHAGECQCRYEDEALHFPGIWRANPSRALPINPVPHLLLQTHPERSVFALRPLYKHNLNETGLVGIPHQEHGSKLNLHIKLIVCCHWQPFANWPLNSTYTVQSQLFWKKQTLVNNALSCRLLLYLKFNYIVCLLQTSSPVIS